MEINQFLSFVDEFGVVIIPFQTAPAELKNLTDGLGIANSGEPDEGEIIIYHKRKLFERLDIDPLYPYVRARQFVGILTKSAYQEKEYGDYMVYITSIF